MSWGNLMQLSPFDVLTTMQGDYSSTNGVNPESIPSGAIGIGAVGFTTDGRRFRLCSLPSTGTTLAACKLIQGPAQVSAYHLGTVSANSIGDGSENSSSGVNFVTYTFNGGATTVAANLFAGGFLSVVTGTGSPQQVQIAGNPAVTSSTTINLTLQDPIVLATANTATAELYVNAYTNPIVTPGSGSGLTAQPIGVPQVGVTVSSNSGQNTYFWAQDQGLATCLGQGATTLGNGAAASTSAAGALAAVAATTSQLATATEAGADGLYTVWDLQIG
jgi:hypothetical protein